MAKSNYEHVKAWRSRPENKPKRAAEARRWRARHPELWKAICVRHRTKNIEEIRERDALNHRAWRASNPEAQRARMRRFKAKQETLLISVAGRCRPTHCELCEEEAPQTAFDHCHETGKFRGWLCQRCNRTLGQVKDSIPLLEKMISYLKSGGLGYGEVNNPSQKIITEVQFRNTK